MKLQPGTVQLKGARGLEDDVPKCGPHCFRHEMEAMRRDLGDDAPVEKQLEYFLKKRSDKAPPPLVLPRLGPHCA